MNYKSVPFGPLRVYRTALMAAMVEKMSEKVVGKRREVLFANMDCFQVSDHLGKPLKIGFSMKLGFFS